MAETALSNIWIAPLNFASLSTPSSFANSCTFLDGVWRLIKDLARSALATVLGRGRGVFMALLGSQIRWEFSPSDREAVQPCVLSSYSIIPNLWTNRCPIKAQLLSSLSTKFIVMGPLGLDPIHPWAQSENRDPTGSNMVWPLTFLLYPWVKTYHSPFSFSF